MRCTAICPGNAGIKIAKIVVVVVGFISSGRMIIVYYSTFWILHSIAWMLFRLNRFGLERFGYICLFGVLRNWHRRKGSRFAFILFTHSNAAWILGTVGYKYCNLLQIQNYIIANCMKPHMHNTLYTSILCWQMSLLIIITWKMKNKQTSHIKHLN